MNNTTPGLGNGSRVENDDVMKDILFVLILFAVMGSFACPVPVGTKKIPLVCLPLYIPNCLCAFNCCFNGIY